MPVMKMLAPDLGFGFAWEPESRNLWIIHANGQPHEQLANGVMTPKEAEVMVEMWCRGYRSRAREDGRVLGNPHHHLLAEKGAVKPKFTAG